MTQDVSWPKASEGGKVVGKEEIRAYWTRQWDEFNPHVEPLATTEEDGGKTRVRVHQHGPYRHHLQLVQRSESKP